ncbi:MAG: DUF4397 domain-containing protein [Calditrichaeota bacterium]|nr:MAG: DUF4397 domain-containing protein [Calditrichota bacterium]
MKQKLFFCLNSLCLIIFGFYGCADVPSSAPEFPDFRTQTRIIHAASDLGEVDVIVQPTVGADFTSLGSLSFQGNTDYLDIPAGNRVFALRSGGTIIDSSSIALESDGKLTLLLLPKAKANEPRFKLFKERRIFDPLPVMVGQVRFINAVMNAEGFNVVNASDSSNVAKSLNFATSSGYLSFQAGSFTFNIVNSNEETVGSAQISLSEGQRFTVVIFGDINNLTVKVFQDDPL